MDIIETYETYVSKIGDRKSLYKSVVDMYNIKSALYPGSHIDISPSFVIPNVTYIDNFKSAISFFNDLDLIENYINSQKVYDENCKVSFLGNDYTIKFDIQAVDLLISQYAGFIGQATKIYLKQGGILLCNDSHGDATLAYFDDDYEFIGIVDSKNRINTSNLEKYFHFAREREVDIAKVHKTMKGPKYKYKAENYLFRLKSSVK